MFANPKAGQKMENKDLPGSDGIKKTPESLIDKHVYNIGGKEFVMHHDYSWDEYEWLDRFLKRIKKSGNVLVSDNISKNEVVKFMGIVLRYKDGSTPSNFNFGCATRAETMYVITDFFLIYALLQISMQEYLKLSETEREKLLMSLVT